MGNSCGFFLLMIFHDTEAMRWKEIMPRDSSNPRPKLLAHTATQIGSYLFIVGGHDTKKYTDEARLFNLSEHHSPLAPSPPTYPLTFGFPYYFSTPSFSLVSVLSATLLYENKPVAGVRPKPRAYHGTLFFDSRLFVFGGYDGTKEFSDVWYVDLAAQAYLAQVTKFPVNGDGEEDSEGDLDDDGDVDDGVDDAEDGDSGRVAYERGYAL